MLQLSIQGRKHLEQREGLRLVAYKDSVGVWTIGYGHTGRASKPFVTSGMTITQAQADEYFKNDLLVFETQLNKLIANTINQDQYDAFVSFAYNIGLGAFGRSTALRQFNLDNIKSVPAAMLLFNKPQEIIGRRKSEALQFQSLL